MNTAKRVTWEGLEARRLLSTSIQLSGGTLLVRGTAGADVIEVSQLPPGGATPLGTPQPSLFVTINGRTRRLDAGSIRRVRVEAGGGDDWVAMGENPFVTGIREAVVTIRQELPATILGGTGNDTLIGGDGNDSMSGGGGCDFLEAGGGDDTVDGDANGDTLEGDAGADLIRGGNGDDRFTIDADDHVFGGAGTDFYAQVPSSGPGC
jgi:Ca2+-binding RTX toxin-like protein